MKDKVYKVTVELDVYGQTSKAAVLEWLEEALHVDGLFVMKTGSPVLIKEEESK